MGDYVPVTKEEQQEMLKTCGLEKMSDLYRDIPDEARLKKTLDLPEGKSELEVRRVLGGLAARNHIFPTIFRGAGAYRHSIPAIVDQVTDQEESLRTAYTPYQAEISQGVLQAIFEYQTDICELTGMDASNACVYDGATAAAEGCAMCRDRRRTKILAAATVDPKVLSVVKTYSFGSGAQVEVIPEKDGVLDQDALIKALTPDVACLLLQSPDYYGNIEEVRAIADAVHAAKAKIVLSMNPIAMAVLETPGEAGVDVAVGEGQPLGLPLGFGGPYVGFMATTAKMMRHLPGRIVGETTDVDGKRGYVLTLQAREQHIRREKASSNICSNEAFCALKISAYLAAMGPEGLREAAVQCSSKAHYLQGVLAEAGVKPVYDKPFFHEFVTDCPDAGKLLRALEEKDILGGLPLSDRRILWCATEMNTKDEMDLTASVAKEVFGS